MQNPKLCRLSRVFSTKSGQFKIQNFKKLKKELPEIQRNISLVRYTTFRIGGPAKYFFAAKNKEDLIKAIKVARKLKLPFFILGGGSNLLVADEGFDGLVIKMQNAKCKMKNENSKCKIFCESGIPLAKLVSKSLQVGATGLEWAAGIPGTVGGAILGNAGAFGSSMANVVKTVEVLDIQGYKIPNPKSQIPNKSQILNSKFQTKILKNRDCKFGYRDSVFKHPEGVASRRPYGAGKKNLIILSAMLQLKKGCHPPATQKKEIEKKIKEYLNYRKKTQPLNFPSAGSIFKNPAGFSAGELIEKCGLKGKRIGDTQISEKHANFIVNLGRGTAKDVMRLIKIIKNKVKKKFGVALEEEIVILSETKKNNPAL